MIHAAIRANVGHGALDKWIAAALRTWIDGTTSGGEGYVSSGSATYASSIESETCFACDGRRTQFFWTCLACGWGRCALCRECLASFSCPSCHTAVTLLPHCDGCSKSSTAPVDSKAADKDADKILRPVDDAAQPMASARIDVQYFDPIKYAYNKLRTSTATIVKLDEPLGGQGAWLCVSFSD